MQPKYLNTLYLYFSLNTVIYLKYTSFLFIFKCHLVFKLPMVQHTHTQKSAYIYGTLHTITCSAPALTKRDAHLLRSGSQDD